MHEERNSAGNPIVFIEVVKPELTMRSLFDSAADRDRVVEEFGAIEGGKQTLGRLAEYLTKM